MGDWHGLQSRYRTRCGLDVYKRQVRKWRGIRLWHIGMAVVFASALMAVSTMFAGEDVTEYYAVIISILFVALYGIMTVLLKLAAVSYTHLYPWFAAYVCYVRRNNSCTYSCIRIFSEGLWGAAYQRSFCICYPILCMLWHAYISSVYKV